METDQTNQDISMPPIQNPLSPKPPIENHKNNAAKFAFFYILSLIALIFMAISIGMIIFQIINKEIVDIINQHSTRYSDESMKFAISAIIITAPIYYLMSRQIYKNLYKGALDVNSGIRKWLTYLILLIAAIVMIVNVIGTLKGFLDGELTLNSILKTVTVLGISGIIFAFYFYDIKREEVKNYKDKRIGIFAYASLAVVIIVFIAAWFFVESPGDARNKKIDQEIMSDLYDVNALVKNYYMKNEELPKNLRLATQKTRLNPSTGEEYEYEIIASDEYRLCADFITSNLDDDNNRNYDAELRWHDKGYQCFDQKVYIDNLPSGFNEIRLK